MLEMEVRKADRDNGHFNGSMHFSLFTDYDINLFKAGKHYHLHKKLGNHSIVHEGVGGTYFGVWAPNAVHVSVIGDFNGWNKNAHVMYPRWDGSGIWEVFIPGIGQGEVYKYAITGHNGYTTERRDPYASYCEIPPATAGKVWNAQYKWTDDEWLEKRTNNDIHTQPLSVYELHLGSWRRGSEEQGKFLTYREIAKELPAYCTYMGFTHVEFMPLMEHPFYGSWGYQVTGYFAPTSRFGTPEDLMYLIDELHKHGIGVILDWVPSHFPTDEHGLGYFDGTHLYEHQDPRKGFHNDWKSFIFNYGRNEVRSFLISNALYWLEKFHIDGLRVDAVASMLYLDYSRHEGEWMPNEYGGRENLEAIGFLREFNDAVHYHYPGVFTVAEESTAWPGVTHPTRQGGLGFDFKWMMGWMHDTLSYFQKDSIYRSHHQNMITFSLHYAFTERFMLPLSHDEVVYGKRSLINKMPGDKWQQFANLRMLYAYMYGHPGAKLIFMGGEFAQHHEWKHDHSVDWHENNLPEHNGIQQTLKDLNHLYKQEPALIERNYAHDGFEWIDFNDSMNSIICWVRKGHHEEDSLVFIANFTPMVRYNYRIGMPGRGYWEEIFNSDNEKYFGSGVRNEGELETAPIPMHGRTHSLSLTLPPLAVIILKQSKKLYYV